MDNYDSGNAVYSDVTADDTKVLTLNDNSCYRQPTSGTAEVSAADVMTGFDNICYGQTTKNAQGSKHACSKIALVILYIIVIALLLALVGACIAFAFEISSVKSETGSIQMASSLQVPQNALVSRIENVENLLQQCGETILQLKNALATQSNESYSAYLLLNHTIQELSEQMNRGFSTIDGNIQLLNASIENIKSSSESVPSRSCAALPPSSPSGYYWITASDGSAVRVYCDMTRSCGGVTGGWMRVAELDMTNSSQPCPGGLSLRNDSDIRTCEITSGASCSSVNFSLPPLQYSRVCGKILAYQVGSTDAFGTHAGPGVRVRNPTIEQNYVDGISLTHGHPRQHIWTFAAALDEVGTFPSLNCRCTNTNQARRTTVPPAFVGGDYFCDTGSDGQFRNSLFYGDDPLWDGAGCGPQNICCSFNNPPWFYKQLPQPTSDDIEMRVCRDEEVGNENVPIEIIELYVQ